MTTEAATMFATHEKTLLQAVEDFQAYAARGLVDEKDL